MIYGLPDAFFILEVLMSKDTLIFVDNGFFRLVQKEFESKLNKKTRFLKSFRNFCENENLNLKHLFFYTAPPYQSEKSSEKDCS